MGGDRRATPLLDLHRKLGARLTEFAGWEMPLQYEGVVAEHTAVRTSVGAFDVSHLGKLRVSGRSNGAALDYAVTADVAAIEPGHARYALALTDGGGCLDDLFVYRIAGDEWLVVPNAANVAVVAGAVESSGGRVTDEWDRWAIIAVQGPDSFALVDKVFPDSTAAELNLHEWTAIDVLGQTGMIARTGYTGERGFEIYAPAEVAPDAFERVVETGATPCGLGARDTLRLEMGYALYGHEIDTGTNPLEAGLSWAVAWDSEFRGKDALLDIKRSGPARRLFGLRCTERGVPRRGYEVVRAEKRLGAVVSGNYSPTLGAGIALAYARASEIPAEGEGVTVDARGRRIPAVIVKPPFVTKR